MEHNGESRQGNIDFPIAFHSKHQTAGGLSRIQAVLTGAKSSCVQAEPCLMCQPQRSLRARCLCQPQTDTLQSGSMQFSSSGTASTDGSSTTEALLSHGSQPEHLLVLSEAFQAPFGTQRALLHHHCLPEVLKKHLPVCEYLPWSLHRKRRCF